MSISFPFAHLSILVVGCLLYCWDQGPFLIQQAMGIGCIFLVPFYVYGFLSMLGTGGCGHLLRPLGQIPTLLWRDLITSPALCPCYRPFVSFCQPVAAIVTNFYSKNRGRLMVDTSVISIDLSDIFLVSLMQSTCKH